MNLVNLRVLDGNGSGTDSETIAAIETAIQLKSKYNIRVINLSLGRGVYESYTLDPLCQAVEQAWKAGIVVVAAGGNFGRSKRSLCDHGGCREQPGPEHPHFVGADELWIEGSKSRGLDGQAGYGRAGKHDRVALQAR